MKNKKKTKKERLIAIPHYQKLKKMESFFAELKDLLAFVDLEGNCSLDQVKRAYKEMSLKYHPDDRNFGANQSELKHLEDAFKMYKMAYDIIIEYWPEIEKMQQSS
jgi:hypothetical protein